MLRIKIVFLSLLVSISTFALSKKQKDMVNYLESVAGVYSSLYAPAAWKKEFSNWSLDQELEVAKNKIITNEITLKEFHKVIKSFILTMKDYHVNIRFHATESSSLPFLVKSAEGKFLFAYIDRTKLPKESFPFKIGDELLAMDGKNINEIVASLKALYGGNADDTDQSLAEMSLTSRKASSALDVPKGPVSLFIKTDVASVEHQLVWEYKKELILRENKSGHGLDSPSKSLKLEMISPIALDHIRNNELENGFNIGGRTSFIPDLGTTLWRSEKSKHHDAYMYLNDQNEVIGYIRIPTYSAGEKESKEFMEVIKKFSKVTDKLVIDQLNNPGGSVFYLYSLVSMLTDTAMYTPKHYMSINQEDILETINELKLLDKITNIEELKKHFSSETVSGYPLSMTFLEFMKDSYRFKIDQWNQGKTLTDPYHIYGVDKINSHPEVSYTKPILLLINELDFSGGDFFPAILQDNKRVTIMGVRTAGAGGYVYRSSIHNQLGVASFSLTASLADRIDNTPIENLGVKPEVDYRLSIEDFKKEFAPFIKAINREVKKLK